MSVSAWGSNFAPDPEPNQTLSVGVTGTSKTLFRARGPILARVELWFVDEGVDDEMGSIDGLVVKIFVEFFGDSLFNVEVSIESLDV